VSGFSCTQLLVQLELGCLLGYIIHAMCTNNFSGHLPPPPPPPPPCPNNWPTGDLFISALDKLASCTILYKISKVPRQRKSRGARTLVEGGRTPPVRYSPIASDVVTKVCANVDYELRCKVANCRPNRVILVIIGPFRFFLVFQKYLKN